MFALKHTFMPTPFLSFLIYDTPVLLHLKCFQVENHESLNFLREHSTDKGCYECRLIVISVL